MAGTTLSAFTVFHVALSLIGIASGLIVVLGFLSRRLSRFWNQLFLWTTALTAVTGFLFPFHGITPGIVIGVVCLLSLAVAVWARRRGSIHLYAGGVCFAEALNVIVLIAQSFQKIPALIGLRQRATRLPLRPPNFRPCSSSSRWPGSAAGDFANHELLPRRAPRSVMREFSRIPNIQAKTRTSRYTIRSLLAVSEQSGGVN